jgi:hypothetical protein
MGVLGLECGVNDTFHMSDDSENGTWTEENSAAKKSMPSKTK